MGLTSSLYSGVSGLSNMGTAMQVIGDNISNINTTAFKGARATFQDIMALNINTASGTSQIGRGSSMADVSPLFIQGSFESTSSPTDLAIAGNGFFIVTDPKVENSLYYTRDGQFHLDQFGYLVNPAGLRVQGWKMETQPDGSAEIIGGIQSIQISNSSPPVATTQTTLTVNLDSRTPGPVSPATLWDDWVSTDGKDAGTLTANVHYEYRTSLNIYDSLGNTHDLTIYFDRTANEREWEFLVTMNPNEDKSAAAGTPQAGMLMRGHIKFTPQGQIEAIYGQAGDPTSPIERFNGGTWEPVTYGDHNYPQLVAFFIPPTGTVNPSTGQDQSAQIIEFNFGAQATLDRTTSPPTVLKWNTDAISSTQYANRSSTIFYDQDGFGPGFLESINVDSEGVISGHYSNGRIVALAQVALARFNAPQALGKEGGNLFRQTTASGPAITGQPRTNGLGSIASNALEQSTVDLGTEFVKLITTQRAFQANSRLITTTDDMMSELLNMKR
ncbi:Flagellar hook protein FlgE [Dissulfuribacter thermophilus]|uniref:Flagellar hook protein FlgE n=1 Tax=Dissulfuribacter thermophilus TaxID=1156395 RepID=A0A1B9F8L5_9BACT|nr:flagellar hook protein FlgE [Dissulfuribacter thermophilus]OCC16266.1 Flagellar hook protein FlgE [Dissulfuribacter thermophilus]